MTRQDPARPHIHPNSSRQESHLPSPWEHEAITLFQSQQEDATLKRTSLCVCQQRHLLVAGVKWSLRGIIRLLQSSELRVQQAHEQAAVRNSALWWLGAAEHVLRRALLSAPGRFRPVRLLGAFRWSRKSSQLVEGWGFSCGSWRTCG